MSAKILSGITVRDSRIKELANKFARVNPAIELAIIQVGDRADSISYIKAKIAFAEKVGVKVNHIHLKGDVNQQNIIDEINRCNKNDSIKGIIVQLPLPENIDREKVINSINPKKDIDGLTSKNVDLLNENKKEAIVPATARGVMELLEYYNVELNDKKVTVVGRSRLVGKPIAQLLLNKRAIVTVAHSKTADLVKETKYADILIVAVGKSKLIKVEHVRSGQIIVDVGINRSDKIVGDVDFEEVSNVIGSSGAITPVPGGVGPMTVLCLFENLADTSNM